MLLRVKHCQRPCRLIHTNEAVVAQGFSTNVSQHGEGLCRTTVSVLTAADLDLNGSTVPVVRYFGLLCCTCMQATTEDRAVSGQSEGCVCAPGASEAGEGDIHWAACVTDHCHRRILDPCPGASGHH